MFFEIPTIFKFVGIRSKYKYVNVLKVKKPAANYNEMKT